MKKNVNAFAYSPDELSGNTKESGLRNPARYGFIYGPGCDCLMETLATAGIVCRKSASKGMSSTPDARITMTDEPNGCVIGYLNGYDLDDTVCVSPKKMMAESYNDGNPNKDHSMLFFIDSDEGLVYGIRLEKLRAVDPIMLKIYEMENDIESRRELAKSNWEYFLNLPLYYRKRREQREAENRKREAENMRLKERGFKPQSPATSLKESNGLESTHSVMDGIRLKNRADLIVEIPHGALCTYRDKLEKAAKAGVFVK